MTGPGTQTLIMGLQRELADLRAQLAERDAIIARQKEMLDEFTRQSHEDRDIIAECEKASYRDGATIARQSEALAKARESLQ